MRILLYNPDNGVTRNFMPHLWMFLLQALTPPGHEVLLIDGNAQPMDEAGLARFVREQNIGLVGIGAMTRMIAKAYRMADAVRAAGVPVVMGGPHVTEMADEALGRDGGPRHADAVALGEADETWPRIVEDAARGELKDLYAPMDQLGKERKPPLQPYPVIPWESVDLDQFNIVPKMAAPLLKRLGGGWGTFRIIPVESGRGCPYGCEFCTVTGFFGDSIRFRTNESVVNELLMLKERARKRARPDRRILHRRQFRHQRQTHEIAPAGHHRRRRAGALGRADQRQPVARRGTGGPDCSRGGQVDLHRHGIHRSGQSART